jgi:hypothetical protein
VVAVAVGEDAAVPGEDRLAAEHVALHAAGGGVVIDGQGAQNRPGPPRLRDDGVLADEVLVLPLRPGHAGLHEGALAVELIPVGAVALLEATGGAVDPDPDGDHPVLRADLEEPVPERGAGLHRGVELPAVLTDVGDA